MTETLDGKKTSVEWEQLLRSSSLVLFDPTAGRDDTDIPLAPAVDGDGAIAARCTDRADRHTDQRDDGDVGERDDIDDQGDNDQGDDEPTLVRVETIEFGDLIRLHEREPGSA